jgi:predicted HTH transcriptional regulator
MTLSETFDALDWPKVVALVDQKQEENLHLDFKLVANSELTNKEDTRNFAKALSGFANSSGGIIIWGIDARKNADKIDCATAVVELVNPPLMVTRLNSMTGTATSPLIEGVRHKPIINDQTGRGVVATLVPDSDSGPYMAKLGEHRYYKRSGDSFYKMEHFDLEDMFGRRQKAKLEILAEHKSIEDGVEEITVRLLNMGRAVARHAGFVMRFENADLVSVSDQLQNASSVNSGRPVVQYNNDTSVIHPNKIRTNLGGIRVRRIDLTLPIKAYVTIYCDGSRLVERTMEVPPSQ